MREISDNPVVCFQINQLLERDEADGDALKNRILLAAETFMPQIDLLTSMKGVSVFIAIAIITDIIDVSRFKNAKQFTSSLRSAPSVASSNTTVKNKGTNKAGGKLASTLLTPSLHHVMNASDKRKDGMSDSVNTRSRGWYGRDCAGGYLRKFFRCSKKGNIIMVGRRLSMRQK